MDESPIRFLEAPHGGRLAYRSSPGAPDRRGVLWLGGYRSDMEGEKAGTLHAWARADDRPFVRFDYSGHGSSEGAFEEGTIGRWRADALAVLDTVAQGPTILVGSSMGGWMALLAALARPDRVAGMILIAPAPDFTDRLMIPNMPPEGAEELARTGVWRRPSPFDPAGDPITARFLEEARAWRVLDAPSIPISAPTRILHGLDDADVPWRLGLETAEKLQTDDVTVCLVKAGDHRLSRPEDLARLTRTAAALARQLDASA